jgi:membrane protein YdbS with pleckstrin-like domain
MSLSQEFKKYQKLERVLTISIILISVLAPISISWIMEKKLHWGVSAALAASLLISAFVIHVIRQRVSQKPYYKKR